MFGQRKKQRELFAQFQQDERWARLELARAIAEDGLTGERRTKTLAKIAEAERKLKGTNP